MTNGTKFLIGAGLVALFAFKNPKKKGSKSYVLIGQGNTPAGSRQVYSKVGTKVYNLNGQQIFFYDFLGAGMTVTSETADKYGVVIGDSFPNGIPGFVFKNSVIV
jgi:hypothetical protein